MNLRELKHYLYGLGLGTVSTITSVKTYLYRMEHPTPIPINPIHQTITLAQYYIPKSDPISAALEALTIGVIIAGIGTVAEIGISDYFKKIKKYL